LLAGVAGTLFGLLLVRRRGVYFAMVTIAFGQVCFYIAYKWDDFTGGYDGLRGFTRAPLDFGLFKIDFAGSGTLFYFFVLFMFGLAVGLQALILRSPFGRTMLAIRSSLAGWVIASSDCSRASGVGGTGMAWTTSAAAACVCSSLMPTNLAPGGSGAFAERSQEQRLGLRHPHDLAEVHALVAGVVVRQMIGGAPYQDFDTRKRLD